MGTACGGRISSASPNCPSRDAGAGMLGGPAPPARSPTAWGLIFFTRPASSLVLYRPGSMAVVCRSHQAILFLRELGAASPRPGRGSGGPPVRTEGDVHGGRDGILVEVSFTMLPGRKDARGNRRQKSWDEQFPWFPPGPGGASPGALPPPFPRPAGTAQSRLSARPRPGAWRAAGYRLPTRVHSQRWARGAWGKFSSSGPAAATPCLTPDGVIWSILLYDRYFQSYPCNHQD